MSSKKKDVYCTLTLHLCITVDAGSNEEAKEKVKDLHFTRSLDYEVGEAYSLSDDEDLVIDDVEDA